MLLITRCQWTAVATLFTVANLNEPDTSMKSLRTLLGNVPHEVNGFFNGSSFENAVDQILKSAHSASSLEDVLARTDQEHSKFFILSISSLKAEREKLLRLAEQARQEAATIHEKLVNGAIPEHSP